MFKQLLGLPGQLTDNLKDFLKGRNVRFQMDPPSPVEMPQNTSALSNIGTSSLKKALSKNEQVGYGGDETFEQGNDLFGQNIPRKEFEANLKTVTPDTAIRALHDSVYPGKIWTDKAVSKFALHIAQQVHAKDKHDFN